MFTIGIECTVVLPPTDLQANYDPDFDNITVLLSDICDSLAETGQVVFRVSGFGQDRWPVDVGTDLVVVLEQLPRVWEALRTSSPTDLDLYEQGIQRTLTFRRTNGETVIGCESMTQWVPDPAIERIDTRVVLDMLSRFRDAFVRLARQRTPGVVSHRWFQEWMAHLL